MSRAVEQALDQLTAAEPQRQPRIRDYQFDAPAVQQAKQANQIPRKADIRGAFDLLQTLAARITFDQIEFPALGAVWSLVRC